MLFYPQNMTERLPVTPSMETHSQTSEKTQTYLKSLLQGTEQAPGLLDRLQTVSTEQELVAVQSLVENIPYTLGALLLTGHADALSFSGVCSTLFTKFDEARKRIPEARNPAIYLQTAKQAASCLEFAQQLSLEHPELTERITRPVTQASIEAVVRAKQKISKEQLYLHELLPNRVLKVRLLAILAEQGKLKTLNSTDASYLSLEVNDLTCISFVWEEDFAPMEECPPQLFSELGERFKKLQELATTLHERLNTLDPRIPITSENEPAWTAWYADFAAYEDHWMKFAFDCVGNVRLS